MQSLSKKLFVFAAGLGLALSAGSALARYQGSLCECVRLNVACDSGDNNACRQMQYASCQNYPTLYGWEEMCGVPLP